MHPESRKFLLDVTLLAMTQVVLFYGAKYMIGLLDPNRAKKEKGKLQEGKLQKRLGVISKNNSSLLD